MGLFFEATSNTDGIFYGGAGEDAKDINYKNEMTMEQKTDELSDEIAKLTESRGWKRVGNATRGTSIAYPSKFNELCVFVIYNKYDVYDTITMPEIILTSRRVVQRGSSEKTGFEVIFTTSDVKLNWAYIESQSISDSSITLYYR